MRIASLLLFACLAVVVACGDDDATDRLPGTTASSTSETVSASASTDAASASDAGSSSTGIPGECPVLDVTESTVLFGGFGHVGVDMRVSLLLPGYARTRLTFEIYEGEGLPAGVAGTFDLTAPPDDRYGACQHCNLLVGYDDLGRPLRTYFQSRGELVLDHYDAITRTLAGRVEGLRVVEVTQSPEDGMWRVVEGGGCFDVSPFAFDTRPVDGGACERVEDCPNEALQVCDPTTRTCGPWQCDRLDDGLSCPADHVCLSQLGSILPSAGAQGLSFGACYPSCVPGAGGCAAGETCFSISAVQDAGVCLAVGSTPVGGACDLPDFGTGCVAGAMCDEPGVCRQACTYLSPQSGCAPGTYCTDANVCRPIDAGDIAPVGTRCASISPAMTSCGPEGDAFRGLCISVFPGEPSACLRLCSTVEGACPGTETCVGLLRDPLVGICHPPAICGDGELDLVGGERCDDGNAVGGDGCSADCKTVDIAPLCTVAEPFVTDVLVVGSNVGGVTGYPTGCSQYQYSPAKTYAFVPPAPGKLSLRLDSATPLTMSVLGDCADATSELKCSFDLLQTGTQALTANFTTAGEPGLIVIAGANPLQEGSFFLHGTFEPAVCGDGDISGIEVCDDGNVLGGDGCSADCAAISWGEICDSLPALDLVAPMIGDLDDGGSQFFDLNGLCSYDGTVEDAYSFTAPSDGTLTLTLTSDEDLVLYAGNGCDAVDIERFVACINWIPEPGEARTQTAVLTAGQRVTVIVEGYYATQAGRYTLEASFGP